MLSRIATLLVLVVMGTQLAYAEQIFTTLRSDADKTIFDGKWTFEQEWKSTSEDIMKFDDDYRLSIKTGHDYENLYVLIDFISDKSIQKFSDMGIVCIYNKMNQNYTANDLYCFSIALGSHTPITLQGDYMLAQTGFFKKVQNHPKLIAVGGTSDNHDRYSDIPHATYEFKIPLEIIGKSDTYGFYVAAYDAKTAKKYGWPQNIATDKYPFVPRPEKWGELISPDKSIPEFNWSLLVLILSLTLSIYLTKFKTSLICYMKL